MQKHFIFDVWRDFDYASAEKGRVRCAKKKKKKKTRGPQQEI